MRAGADAAVPCRATARAAPSERPRLGSQTRARGLRRLRHRQPPMLRLQLLANTCLRHRPQQSGFTETRLSWGWARAPAVTQQRPSPNRDHHCSDRHRQQRRNGERNACEQAALTCHRWKQQLKNKIDFNSLSPQGSNSPKSPIRSGWWSTRQGAPRGSCHPPSGDRDGDRTTLQQATQSRRLSPSPALQHRLGHHQHLPEPSAQAPRVWFVVE